MKSDFNQMYIALVALVAQTNNDAALLMHICCVGIAQTSIWKI